MSIPSAIYSLIHVFGSPNISPAFCFHHADIHSIHSYSPALHPTIPLIHPHSHPSIPIVIHHLNTSPPRHPSIQPSLNPSVPHSDQPFGSSITPANPSYPCTHVSSLWRAAGWRCVRRDPLLPRHQMGGGTVPWTSPQSWRTSAVSGCLYWALAGERREIIVCLYGNIGTRTLSTHLACSCHQFIFTFIIYVFSPFP